jgi:hypothetical protein
MFPIAFTSWQQVRSRKAIAFPPMSDDVISDTRAKLEKRLEELRPAVEEASKIEAALRALKNGPAPPVTVLDTLKSTER